MRHLVLSDLHGNLEAMEAVLERARGLGFDRALALGDLVGYGADPNPVLDLLRALPGLVAIRGNHDKVAAGLEEGGGFSYAALAAVLWTRTALRADLRDHLAGLPRGPLEFAPGSFLAHGSPLDEDAYLLSADYGRECFEGLPFRLCFFGHTHLPCAFILEEESLRVELLEGDRTVLALREGGRYLVNPGSVGQPRDRDPRASFALYDDLGGTVTIHRVDYPVETARRKILGAGLPPSLGNRLRRGV